ncbi:MAG: L,D-transpeptidase [Lachnospiraceae bacterium]|nr:L,D-transpeptidase [Lachnospiraceae bacterium]
MKIKRLLAGFLVFVMCFTCVTAQSTVDTEAASYNGKYWIKVNYQRNVATVYKKADGKWKPVKAMLTSCGTNTPKSGSFYTTAKYRWKYLMGPSYGQYSTRIVGSILFHSVWYYSNGNRQSQSVAQFNKLGTTASHGCVRLSTADSKWVYDNCAVGTKVTFYKSSDPGPLGKPAAYKMPSSAGKMNWDPTDASANNPYYQTLPVLTQKYKTISYGSKNNTPEKLVTAKQKNGTSLQSLTTTTTKWDASQGKYVSAKFSTKKEGTYKIKYKAVSTKGVSITKTFKFVVKDTAAPTIKASDRTAALNSTNAVKGMTATMKNGTDRTKAVKVYVKAPGSSKFSAAKSYTTAKTYKFSKTGTYTIKYTVTCKNKTLSGKYNTATKTIKVTVKKPTITRKYKKIYRGVGTEITASALKKYVTAKDHAGNALNVSVEGVEDIDNTTAGEYKVTFTAVDKSKNKVTTMMTVVIVDLRFEANEGYEELTDGMTITVPSMDEESVKAAVEAYGEFKFDGSKTTTLTPEYTIDEAAGTCTLSFVKVPGRTITLNLLVQEAATTEEQ